MHVDTHTHMNHSKFGGTTQSQDKLDKFVPDDV